VSGKSIHSIIATAVRDGANEEGGITDPPLETPPATTPPATPPGETPPAKTTTPSEQEPFTDVPEDLLTKLAPKKEEGAPAETDDERALRLAQESDEPPKEGKVWGALKAKLKEYETELATLKSQPRQMPEETLTEYENRLKEKDALISQLSLEHSEQFQMEYDAPIRQQLGRAAKILEQHAGLAPEAANALVGKAIRMPFADRNRFLAEEASELQGVLSTILLDVDERVQTRAEALQNAAATKEALKESELRTTKVSTVRAIDEHLNQAVADLVDEGNIFFSRSQEDSPRGKAWNQAVETRVQAVRQTLLKNALPEITKYVADGFAARELREELVRVNELLKQSRAENRAIQAKRPGVRGRDGQMVDSTATTGLTKQQIIQQAFTHFKP